MHIPGACLICFSGDNMNIPFLLMIVFFVLASVVAVLVVMVKCGFFKSFLFCVISGVGTLLAVHFTSLTTGIGIPVNICSMCTSVFGGIPAVAAMAIMNIFR